MAIETRPDTNQELPEESPYDALMAYGKERGYKLDWLQQQDSWGSRPDVGDTDSGGFQLQDADLGACLLYTSPSPRDRTRSRMPSSA